jgi:sigma-54 dependent transcriptional regulator, acetoin dehydrogenase operon transcriptional activator AcoR
MKYEPEHQRRQADLMALQMSHQRDVSKAHERSKSFGLAPTDAPDLHVLSRAELQHVLDCNLPLYSHAVPVMDMLHEQIAHSHSMLVLTDAQGIILHALGDDDFLERAQKVALAQGSNWSEACKGTNAVGTAIAARGPTVIHGAEHFHHANQFLTCSASPIFNAFGQLVGVLDVSSDQRAYQPYTLALMRMSTRIIENTMLEAEFQTQTLLRFHPLNTALGSLQEGIVAIDDGGRILGANRAAVQWIGISDQALKTHTLSTVFGISFASLFDHAGQHQIEPRELMLYNRKRVFARAQHPARNTHVFTSGLTPLTERQSSRNPLTLDDQSVGLIHLPANNSRDQRPLDSLRTGDAAMNLLLDKVNTALDDQLNVLILGASGTGKEMLARAMHQQSPRRAQEFQAVNCSAYSPEELEALLFSPTHRNLDGPVGTLFLDEVEALPLSLQAKLARHLQDRPVIGASCQSVLPLVQQRLFREELYYRMAGLVVRLPALHQRSDLTVLIDKLLAQLAPGQGKRLTDDVTALFREYAWPGNIRQLRSVLATAVAMSGRGQLIQPIHLSDDFLEDLDPVVRQEARIQASESHPAETSRLATLEERELELIRAAVQAANGNISLASKRLGISRNTIYRKLRWNLAQTGQIRFD